MKYSIIIGAYNHLADCTRPCVESVLKYTDMDSVEVIVVANGCNDGTEDYIKSLGAPFKCLSYPGAVGFPKAYNTGIEYSTGDMLVLLNNDAFLTEQPNNKWLEILEAPFVDEKVGIVGRSIVTEYAIARNFVEFFCVMVPRRVIRDVGVLNEDYGYGCYEDVEFCFKLEERGYKLSGVNEPLPIYHKNHTTYKELANKHHYILENRKKLLTSLVEGTLGKK